MHHLHDATLENQTVELTDKREHHYLGPSLVLVGCRVVIQAPASALTVTTVRMTKCHIDVKKKLSSFRWCNAFLEECRFTGTLVGSDFGHWPEVFDPAGGIRSCDFSEARLDGCRFIGCDMNTMRLPAWPCFTILNPVARATELAAIAWPGDLRFAIDTFRVSPPTTAAITSWAPALVKELGGTEAELRAVLTSLDGVRM